jgi:RND family efflux transporter MFP subunit
LTALFLVSSCAQKVDDSLETKKQTLKEYEKELAELKDKIGSLKEEIQEKDPNFANGNGNTVLVKTIELEPSSFRHKVEIRGGVQSRKNIVVSSESTGRILHVNAKEGDQVKKGDLLIKINDRLIRDNIAELETALELAIIKFERQKNVWDQKIGSELQYLQAKNEKESLERRLATAKTQLSYTNIRAPFDGTVEEVFVKEGEMAQMSAPMVRVVSFRDMYIEAEISERYIGKFREGDPVEVFFPSLDRKVVSTIKAVGQVINPENRTFKLEIKLPGDLVGFVKPNLVTVVEVTDYSTDSALVVPSNIIQKDRQGNFVYLAEENGDKTEARKVHIQTGVTYRGNTEIKDGLAVGQKVITDGHREAVDGAPVNLSM